MHRPRLGRSRGHTWTKARDTRKEAFKPPFAHQKRSSLQPCRKTTLQSAAVHFGDESLIKASLSVVGATLTGLPRAGQGQSSQGQGPTVSGRETSTQGLRQSSARGVSTPIPLRCSIRASLLHVRTPRIADRARAHTYMHKYTNNTHTQCQTSDARAHTHTHTHARACTCTCTLTHSGYDALYGRVLRSAPRF